MDPRWEWGELVDGAGQIVRVFQTSCNHLEVVPVDSDGETVAHLCMTCDSQLPAEWRP